MNETPLSVVYVTGTYPLVTTTFIDREICELRRRGVAITVVGVRRPPPEAPLSADQRRLQADVRYLLPFRARTLLRAHGHFARRSPRRYLEVLAWLLTRSHPSLTARAKTVLHFGEGVLAAYVVRDVRPHELHAHFADRAATIALVAARLLGTPYSMSVHAGADLFVEPVLLHEKVHGARRVMTCTAHNKARITSIVGPELARKVEVVRHGVDVAKYDHPSSAPGTVPLVLAVGQLAPRKGLADLVAACRELVRHGVEFRCDIVGAGPQRDQLQHAIIAAGVADRVRLCGAQSQEQVIEQYARAAVFVLPCTCGPDGDVDGIPNVLAEALAMRVPVVSTDLPAIRELLTDGTDALLVSRGDVVALAAAIERVLTDPVLAHRLRVNGRRTVVEQFDIEANVGRFAAALWPEHFAPVQSAHRR
jgi:glycosyltransferase involved in cell wall biosynthesis